MTPSERSQLFLDEVLPHIKDVVSNDCYMRLVDMGFFNAPASTRFHGAYEGGLFDHSYNVMSALVTLTKREFLCWSRPESPYIVGIFHDLCKCDSYLPVYDKEVEKKPSGYKYNEHSLIKGHGDKSVMVASTLLTLTPEEVLCIRYHMGAFTDKSEWTDYTDSVHIYSNVLWTHTADMLAAHVMEVGND